MATKQKRAWQRMLSGRRLDLLDPSPIDVEIEDIAHGLARVARWNGQTSGDYTFSVAQHSLLVLQIFKNQNKENNNISNLFALLHDASEYVMGDIISPFKVAMGGDYKKLENRLLNAVHLRFSLPANPSLKIKKAIKSADNQAAFFEATNLAGFEKDEASKLFKEPNIASFDIENFESLIRPWPTQEAQRRFKESFDILIKHI
jgi:hypothetical protein